MNPKKKNILNFSIKYKIQFHSKKNTFCLIKYQINYSNNTLLLSLPLWRKSKYFKITSSNSQKQLAHLLFHSKLSAFP